MDSQKNPSLFLSVHGAEVEAISQARAYKPKTEGPIVAPTNRRPRGFNWEDWGRLDALEVLEIAKNSFPRYGANIVATFSLPKFYENFDVENNTISNSDFEKEVKDIVEQIRNK